jgi:glycogen debranching enzyme
MPPRVPDQNLVRLRPRTETIYVSKGRTVLATGRDGFLGGGAEQGLFVYETRLLSHYRYLVDGQPFYPVSLSNVEQHSWLGYYIAPAPTALRRSKKFTTYDSAQQSLELRLSRYVGEGIHEDIDLTNFTQDETAFTLTVELDGDFADPDETHGTRRQRGKSSREWIERDGAWELAFDYQASHRYSHQGERGTASIQRGVRVCFSHTTTNPEFDNGCITFAIVLGAHGTWHCCVEFIPVIEGRELTPRYGCRSFSSQNNEYDRRTGLFLDEATRFSSPESPTLSPVVVGALEQGKRDLAALRLYDLDGGDRAWTTAAGLPMYVALFGRDTLTVAWEAAPVSVDLMRGTLPVLTRLQGREVNDWRDEQPGKMLHEAHTGPLSALNYKPQGLYYGSVTTSGFYPFVVALLWYWTGNKELVRPYLDPAIAALKWLNDCDHDADGFCEYKTRSERGVSNQGWKDSEDAIVYEDGSQVPKPAATCEEQGIVYAAKINLAAVLWWLDRKGEAKRLYHEAKELKKRFNEAFWNEDEGFFAMALDPDKRQVKSIGSNALHCIATGIADKALVKRTLERLFADDMFTGWGVRTLSSQHPAYNPYSYHRGTVWPVEHGPFAVGAYRYGCHDYVERICRSQFEMTAIFDYFRLPECVAGHQRDDDHPFPAVYPAANSPQAWSATTVYTLLQAMLGLQPFAPFRMLFVDPFLPAWLPEITIAGLRVSDAKITIRFFRKPNGHSDYEVVEQEGRLTVIRQPSPWSLTASFAERVEDILVSFTPWH